jgi:hypothetical protein
MTGAREVPLNERMAVVEAQVVAVSGAVVEIKDAVVAIRGTLDHVARIDERLVTVAEQNRELRRSLEAERDNRVKCDQALDSRVHALEQSVPFNTLRLNAVGSWTMRVSAGIALIGVGYVINLLTG